MKNDKFWVLLFALLIMCFALLSPVRGDDNPGKAALFIQVKVNKSLDQALIDLKQAITNNNYVYIRQQNVDGGLTNVAEENGDVIFVYFCNFALLDQALKIDRRVGVFLPCKITLVQTPQGVEMIAVDPKQVSKHLNDRSLNELCDQLARDYRQILEEASL